MSDEVHVMSFQEHLTELRGRLIRIAAALILGFMACWTFREELFAFLSGPISRALADNGIYHFQTIEITESIIVYLKTAFVGSVVVTSPVTFYQLWAFVSPGLLQHERRFVGPVTFFTVLFFVIGSAFAYRVILPFITDYLVQMTMAGGHAEVMVTLQNAYSTAFIFLLIFGLVFELPLVIFFLALFGMVTSQGLLKFFRYFVVLSIVAGAVLTPPDPISQVLMAVPLNVLYVFGILVAWGVERSRLGAPDGEGPSAGATLTKLLGSSVVLFGVATALIILFVQTLPQKDLHELLPAEVTWIVGANPSVLAESAAAESTLRRDRPASPWFDAFGAADLRLADIREAALVGTADGERALIVRADDLAGRRDEVAGALPEGSESLVVRLDDDTLAIGPERLAGALRAAADGDRDTIGASDEEERLLQELTLAGPLWAWVPDPARNAARFVGEPLATTLAAAGAWVRPGDPPRVALAFHASDREEADEVETRLDALRTVRSEASDGERRELLAAMTALATELRYAAPPHRFARVAALEERLRAMGGEQDAKPDLGLPAITSVGNRATGWALRRDALRLRLTAELEPDGLAQLLKPLFDALE